MSYADSRVRQHGIRESNRESTPDAKSAPPHNVRLGAFLMPAITFLISILLLSIPFSAVPAQ